MSPASFKNNEANWASSRVSGGLQGFTIQQHFGNVKFRFKIVQSETIRAYRLSTLSAVCGSRVGSRVSKFKDQDFVRLTRCVL